MLFRFIDIYACGVYMGTGVCIPQCVRENQRTAFGVRSRLQPWDLGLEFMSSGFPGMRLYTLSHFILPKLHF